MFEIEKPALGNAGKFQPSWPDQRRKFLPLRWKMAIMSAVLVGAGLFLIASAFAAEAPVKPEPGLPKTGLTINDCLLILQGLNAIDEHIVVVGDKGKEQLVKQSYEYGPGGFRINFLAHNIRAMTTVQQDAQAEQQKILRDMLAKMPPKDGKPAAEIPPGTPEAIEYDRRLKELTAAPCMANLVHFKEPELKLEKNELPGWALSNLDPIRDK